MVTVHILYDAKLTQIQSYLPQTDIFILLYTSCFPADCQKFPENMSYSRIRHFHQPVTHAGRDQNLSNISDKLINWHCLVNFYEDRRALKSKLHPKINNLKVNKTIKQRVATDIRQFLMSVNANNVLPKDKISTVLSQNFWQSLAETLGIASVNLALYFLTTFYKASSSNQRKQSTAI